MADNYLPVFEMGKQADKLPQTTGSDFSYRSKEPHGL